LPDDTVDSLSARILVQEHRIYPRAIAQVLGQATLHGPQFTVDSSQSVDEAEPALVRSVPFAPTDAFRIVQLHAGEDDLTQRLRDAFPQATIKTLPDPFDAASLAWWDVMVGADLIVAPFIMPKLTDAKKQYLYKAIADRVSPRGGALVLDRVVGEYSPLLHHLIWLKHAGFAEVDCRWLVDGAAVFGGFTPARTAQSASAPRLPAGS